MVGRLMGAVMAGPALLPHVAGRPLRRVMVERLIDSGTWCSGVELAAGLSASPVAIEDALADLVIEGQAEFRQAEGYRLAGGVQARRAAWLLRNRKNTQGGRLRRAAFGTELGGNYRVGVAEMRNGVDCGPDGLGLVMYELVMPMPPEGPDQVAHHMSQVQAVVDFINNDGGANG
jgi:biotin operon repressor